MGCAFLKSEDAMNPILDEYVAAGGTVFDTAPRYGAGLVDRLLGQWMQSRAIRSDITVIGKGAFDPCRPEEIGPGLDRSLNDLKTDYLDLYFLHRDNVGVPAAEFVDALNQEVAKGRIRAFGGSNWSTARIDEGNRYAAERGLRRFEALSNQFSLAKMIQPVWPGTLALSSDEDLDWIAKSDVVLFAWSSQARGFFTDHAGRGKQVDPEFMASWYSDENFARRDRAEALASQLGTTLPRVALAYVLAQPFPTIPIIGPLTTAELREALGALDVDLTPPQVAWLRAGV
jgi:aryl-alcohol dehydrogenase-like predicted oxidoreductase